MGKPAKKRRRRRVIVETRTVFGVLYQRELVRCGNKRCNRCRLRAVHGPYWYSYRWSKLKRRLVSKYVGKELRRTPAELLGAE
jgi:hypothetical protein